MAIVIVHVFRQNVVSTQDIVVLQCCMPFACISCTIRVEIINIPHGKKAIDVVKQILKGDK